MPRHARAWLALTTALALHVVDEAMNDFLGFYNPMVLRMRETLGWFPMPTFAFWPWLIGLTLLVLFLYALTPAVARGGHWLRIASYPFAVILLLNGVGHIAFSIAERRMVAGVWTAPLLLATSLYMLWSLRARRAYDTPPAAPSDTRRTAP